MTYELHTYPVLGGVRITGIDRIVWKIGVRNVSKRMLFGHVSRKPSNDKFDSCRVGKQDDFLGVIPRRRSTLPRAWAARCLKREDVRRAFISG